MRCCLLLTQSGHERLRIAALQTDPETHFAAHKFLLLMKERPHRTVPQNENREAAETHGDRLQTTTQPCG